MEITKFIDREGDDELESYINDEDKVIVSEVYQDAERAVKREYYFRRIKKLSQTEARLVATAIDLNASVISNNKKILLASRGSGLMCSQINALMKLDPNERLHDRFYELSLQMSNAKNVDLPLQSSHLLVLKKN